MTESSFFGENQESFFKTADFAEAGRKGVEMPEIDAAIRDKDIIIWGIGALQSDLEGTCSLVNILYYIDDYILEKNLICVSKEKVFPSDKLAEENRNNVLVILCTENQEEAIEKLETMGYGKESYVLGEELLARYIRLHQSYPGKIAVWGTGNTYHTHEDSLRRYGFQVTHFIVTEKTEEYFQEKEILSPPEHKEMQPDSFVAVASVYYKEIYKSLTDLGMQPGKNFMHIDTLMAIHSLIVGTGGEFQFDNRKQDRENLLVILAGYKEFVWENVFERLIAFVPEEIDVCIVTSGLVNERLKKLCERQQWSYMSTGRNNVSLAVNLAVFNHPEAKYIYKMDEDIFLTKGIFETLKDTYIRAQRDGRYVVGFATPLIPVNGYGHVRLLEIFGAADLWEKQFGTLKYTNNTHHKNICENPQAARFMWGEGNPAFSDLDEIQKILSERAFQYSICPIRYSIGFILFQRSTWIHMGGFPVLQGNMGVDEEAFCQYCMIQSKAIVVAENAVVGHLGYGPQNEEMEQYYHAHREKFQLKTEGEHKTGR